MGLGDIVGFLGPFYCAAGLFFLLEIILYIAGKKKKAAAIMLASFFKGCSHTGRCICDGASFMDHFCDEK